MPLYSFKGHYPVEQIDNNKGWYEVPDKPVAPEGKEVAWVNAEWVVRDPKPQDRAGYQWNWSHNDMAWVECEYSATADETTEPETNEIVTGLSMDLTAASMTSFSLSVLAPSITSAGDI